MNSPQIYVNSLQNSCSWQREMFYVSLNAMHLGVYPLKSASSRPHVQNLSGSLTLNFWNWTFHFKDFVY